MSTVPTSLIKHLETKVDAKFTQTRRVSGGSINEAARLYSEQTGPCFLKWNRSDDPDMFVKEVKGLKLLASAETDLVIPGVIEQGVMDNGTTAFLLMDYIEEGSAHNDSARKFGVELARMHQKQAGQHGLDHDNYIGRLLQSNKQHDNWVDFFVNERIDYQLQIAFDRGSLPRSLKSNFENMYRELPNLMPEEPPSLLHGDLWGGNYFYDSEGNAAIFDPALYYGSREMELAFTHMFGGFSSEFYEGYESEWPLESGFNERVDLYNLYHLMTHTNMFGGHYARQVQSIVEQF